MIPNEERPLGELFRELANQTGTLVRQEVSLARVEMSEKIDMAAKQASVVAGGGVLFLLASIALVTALIAGVGLLVPLWIAALGTGIVASLAGYLLVKKGMAGLRSIDPAPSKTIRTLEEDKLWLKRELSR
jgi:hypothetical protein